MPSAIVIRASGPPTIIKLDQRPRDLPQDLACSLLGTPAFDQAPVMLADDGVPADSGEGGHIEGITNVGSSTGDRASTTHLPGIAVDRRDTDESGDTPSIELAEFGQIGNQGE